MLLVSLKPIFHYILVRNKMYISSYKIKNRMCGSKVFPEMVLKTRSAENRVNILQIIQVYICKVSALCRKVIYSLKDKSYKPFYK